LRRPPISEAILEEEEDEEDFFPRPSKHVTTTLISSKDDHNHHSSSMHAATTPLKSNKDDNSRFSSHIKSGLLPSLDDLPQPFGRLELDGPTERPSLQSSNSQQRRSLSSRLSSEKDHREREDEDLGFERPGRFTGGGRGGLQGQRSWEEPEDEEGPAGELESLEKYRPHNYEFSKPKSEDINDLMDFYSSYRAHGKGRSSGSGGGGVYRQRSLDSDEGGVSSFHLGEEELVPPRKKYSDPGQQHRYDGGVAYQNGAGGGRRAGFEQNGRRNAPEENGFYDLDSIDPATRLILERARQTRSRPMESIGSSFLRDGSPGLDEDFRSLRPPPGIE